MDLKKKIDLAAAYAGKSLKEVQEAAGYSANNSGTLNAHLKKMDLKPNQWKRISECLNLPIEVSTTYHGNGEQTTEVFIHIPDGPRL